MLGTSKKQVFLHSAASLSGPAVLTPCSGSEDALGALLALTDPWGDHLQKCAQALKTSPDVSSWTLQESLYFSLSFKTSKHDVWENSELKGVVQHVGNFSSSLFLLIIF